MLPILFISILLPLALARPYQPVEASIDFDMFLQIAHSVDESLLKNFDNLPIESLELVPEAGNIRNVTFFNTSLSAESTPFHMNYEKLEEGREGLNVRAPRVRFSGKAMHFLEEGELMSHERVNFEFEGIIEQITFDIVIKNPSGPEDDQQVAKFSVEGLQVQVGEGLQLKYSEKQRDSGKVQGEHLEKLELWVGEQVQKTFRERFFMVSDLVSLRHTMNDEDQNFELPVISMIPLVNFAMVAQYAHRIQINAPHYILVQFSPAVLDKLFAERMARMEPISHDKFHPEEAGSWLVVDQSVLNGMLDFASDLDSIYSLQDIVEAIYPGMGMGAGLKTGLFQMFMPSIVQEHGVDKQVDIGITTYGHFINNTGPVPSKSTFQIDEKGNIKLGINFALAISVQDAAPDQDPSLPFSSQLDSGSWQIVRVIYVGLSFQVKVDYEAGVAEDGVASSLARYKVKGLQVSQFKVYREVAEEREQDRELSEEEEDDQKALDMEGMMIQSLANLQLEKLKPYYPGEANRTQRADDLQLGDCYGVLVGLPEVEFFKGGVVVHYPRELVEPNQASCEKLEREFEISRGRYAFHEHMDSMGGMDPMKFFGQGLQKGVEKAKEFKEAKKSEL